MLWVLGLFICTWPASADERDGGTKRADEGSSGVKPQPAPAPLHSIRLQGRIGTADDPGQESSLQATYFSRLAKLSIFANAELVLLKERSPFLETEVNLGYQLFPGWLAPIWPTVRFTSDHTEFQTFSVGPQINLTAWSGIQELAKKWGFDVFVQYYPLKTDNHLGDEEFLFRYQATLVRSRLYIRGFSRLYLFHDQPSQTIHVEDLIYDLQNGFDVYLRYAILEDPRVDGVSVGVRYLIRF